MAQLELKNSGTNTIGVDRPMAKFFHPRSVAVIGASQDPNKVGYTVLRNLESCGFQGQLFAVNPKYLHVSESPCVASVTEIGHPIDLAIVCTPVHTVGSILRECGNIEVGGTVILTAGFQETGQSGSDQQAVLEEICDEFPDMRVIGPNCVGIINASSKLNASFARGMPTNGRISFISQSGALCTAVLDWALQEGIGFANFVSIGNMMDVGWGELIDYFANDPETDALVMYVESVNDAESFMAAAARCTIRKPIIACKSGRYKQSAAAAASHTGALAGEDVVYDTVFRRLGIQRVATIEEMFDTAEALARLHRNAKLDGPATEHEPLERSAPQEMNRLAIISNAGGPAVMATDALIEGSGNLANLSAATVAALDEILPQNWSKQNPVDVIGDATPARLADSTRIVLRDPGVDAALVIVSPQAMTAPKACADGVLEVARQYSKPILTSWMGGESMKDAVAHLNRGNLPTFPTPERAIKAYLNITKHRSRTDHDILIPTPAVETRPISSLPTEVDAKQLLAEYLIDVVPTKLANSEDEAAAFAGELGFPAVVKIASPELTHKSDFGGVKLRLPDEHAVREAYRAVIAAAHNHNPQAIVMGVSVQPIG